MEPCGTPQQTGKEENNKNVLYFLLHLQTINTLKTILVTPHNLEDTLESQTSIFLDFYQSETVPQPSWT